jgi:chromosome segregation ATPase
LSTPCHEQDSTLLIFQIEKSEYSKKESVISSLEISLQQVRNTLQDTEYENVQLRHRIEDLTEDQRKLMTLNASLETKMETEKKLVKNLRYKANDCTSWFQSDNIQGKKTVPAGSSQITYKGKRLYQLVPVRPLSNDNL